MYPSLKLPFKRKIRQKGWVTCCVFFLVFVILPPSLIEFHNEKPKIYLLWPQFNISSLRTGCKLINLFNLASSPFQEVVDHPHNISRHAVLGYVHLPPTHSCHQAWFAHLGGKQLLQVCVAYSLLWTHNAPQIIQITSDTSCYSQSMLLH